MEIHFNHFDTYLPGTAPGSMIQTFYFKIQIFHQKLCSKRQLNNDEVILINSLFPNLIETMAVYFKRNMITKGLIYIRCLNIS